jgi:hypothetical protein
VWPSAFSGARGGEDGVGGEAEYQAGEDSPRGDGPQVGFTRDGQQFDDHIQDRAGRQSQKMRSTASPWSYAARPMPRNVGAPPITPSSGFAQVVEAPELPAAFCRWRRSILLITNGSSQTIGADCQSSLHLDNATTTDDRRSCRDATKIDQNRRSTLTKHLACRRSLSIFAAQADHEPDSTFRRRTEKLAAWRTARCR